MAFMNGQYYGGGFHPSLQGKPDDGLFEFIGARGISRLKISKLVKHYKHGEHEKLGDVIITQTCTEAVIKSKVPFVFNYDGEVSKTNDLTIKIVPKAIRFILPNI
jgi:diacylglycerol kinase family enzyme